MSIRLDEIIKRTEIIMMPRTSSNRTETKWPIIKYELSEDDFKWIISRVERLEAALEDIKKRSIFLDSQDLNFNIHAFIAQEALKEDSEAENK